MRHTPLALALGALTCSPFVYADSSANLGDTVYVTSTRFPEPLGSQAPNVTVISRAEIERNPATTLPDLLADYAGVGVRDLYGNNASNATVDLRGFGAAAGENTLVLVDGRRQNDIDLSGVVWSAIPLAAIERIEITRGGASVLYGAGAVGGVINIVTRSPLGKPNEGSIAARAGSFGTQDVQAYGNLRGDAVGVTLAANRHRADGWRANNADREDSVYGDARWKLPASEYVLKFGADTQNIGLPGGRTVQPSIGLNELADDRAGTDTPYDWASRDGWQLGLTGNYTLAAADATVDLGYRNKAQESYFYFGGFPDYRRSDLDMFNFSPRIKLAVGDGPRAHELIAGLDANVWNYTLDTSNAPDNIGQPIHRVDARQHDVGVYVRDAFAPMPALALNAGARIEWFRLRADDAYDASAPGGAFDSGAADGSQSAREYAWELGARYSVAVAQTLYAKLARSFRFATVDEIYEYTPSFDRQFQFLKPQTAHDAELGWEFGNARNGGRAALYYARVRDEIHLDPYDAGIGNTNLPPLDRYGIELEARTHIGPVDLTGAYTLAYARFTDGSFGGISLDGKNVPLVPRHKLALNLGWAITATTRLSASANFVSAQFLDNDESNSFGSKIPAYAVADFKLDHRVGDWTFAVSVDNAFDARYYSYAVRSNFTPDRYAAYPLPGRSGWVSAEYQFR